MEPKSYLRRECLYFDLEVQNKDELLETMVSRLCTFAKIDSPWPAINAVQAREAIGSTGLARGVASPHGIVPGLHQTLVGVARLVTPVDFGASDGQASRHIFLVLSPEDGDGLQHIRAMAEVVQCYKNPGLVKLLDQAKSPDEYWSLLNGCLDD